MGYKISGNVADPTRIIIVDEATWTTEHTDIYNGDYEIDVTDGDKVIIGRLESGQSTGFGAVGPVLVLGDRGVFAGGSYTDTMDYVTISTTGDAQSFGNISTDRSLFDACSNGGNDRGVFAKGYTGSTHLNIMEYITISTTGNAADFGDVFEEVYSGNSGESNGTNDRGIFGGGQPTTDRIEYITISTTSNSTDFGNMVTGGYGCVAVSNKTLDRCLWGGGDPGGSNNTIQYVTISTPGNATDIGDLTFRRRSHSGTGNGENDRAIWAGGMYEGSPRYNVIDYVTISTAGNASDFGDLSDLRNGVTATSNVINNRGVISGGSDGSTLNIIEYITISTLGDAQDFGDLVVVRSSSASTSNA